MSCESFDACSLCGMSSWFIISGFGRSESFHDCSNLVLDLVVLRKSGPKQNANPSDKLPSSTNFDNSYSFVYQVTL